MTPYELHVGTFFPKAREYGLDWRPKFFPATDLGVISSLPGAYISGRK
jgi:hypothetical protein